eukprot:m.87467 g.87467  ORF g.87467 m.87467 type:complete len:445 (-) comp15129_c0_seq1:1643-2977(-)
MLRKPAAQQRSFLQPLVVAGLIVLAYLLFTGRSRNSGDIYGIIIDAGSTGSRIHVYRFSQAEDGSGLVLRSELFEQLKPGLSSYKGQPQKAAASLAPLLLSAVKHVPSHLHSTTPINLKATAGLRLLPKADADAILEECARAIQAQPFYFDQADAVEVMGGTDEGLFGWVTVNYLRRSLRDPSDRTACILDLGGGSTQIATSVRLDGAAASLPVTEVMGAKHHMFIYSHLGYGLMAGRAAILGRRFAAESKERHGEAPFVHPCLHASSSVTYSYGKESFKASGDPTASSQPFEKCLEEARLVINDPEGSFKKSARAPALGPQQPVFAMSYYFDRAIDVGLVAKDALEAVLQPQLYRKAAKETCSLSVADLAVKRPDVDAKDAPFLCMDLCFIISLLEDGFGLSPSTQMLLARKLEFNGELVETAWALGASLDEISETQRQLADL